MWAIENQSISNIPKEEKVSSPVLKDEQKNNNQLSESKTLEIMKDYGLGVLPIDTSAVLDWLKVDISPEKTSEKIEYKNSELKYVLSNYGNVKIPKEELWIWDNSFTVLWEQQEKNTNNVRNRVLSRVNNIILDDYKNPNKWEVSIDFNKEENPSWTITYTTQKTSTTLEIKNNSNRDNKNSNRSIELSSVQHINPENWNINFTIQESINSWKKIIEIEPEEKYDKNWKLIPLADNIVKDKKTISSLWWNVWLEWNIYSNNWDTFHRGSYTWSISNRLQNDSWANSKSVKENYKIEELVWYKKWDLKIYAWWEISWKRSKKSWDNLDRRWMKSDNSEKNKTKKNKIYAGVNYEVGHTLWWISDNQDTVSVTPTTISARVSRTNNKTNTEDNYWWNKEELSTDTFNLSYDSKYTDFWFKKEVNTDKKTWDKTSTETSQFQLLSKNINPDSLTVSKDWFYYKTDWKRVETDSSSELNWNSSEMQQAAKTTIWYHNNNANIDISATKWILWTKYKWLDSSAKNKSEYTKVNLTQDTFLWLVNAEIKKTTNKNTDDWITTTEKIKETKIWLQTDNLNVNVSTSNTEWWEKTRTTEVIYSRELEWKIDENWNKTYANIDASLTQNTRKWPDTYSSDSTSNLDLVLWTKNEKNKTNYYMNTSIVSTKNSNLWEEWKINNTSSSQKSLWVWADFTISPWVDAKIYVNHIWRESSWNNVEIKWKTNSLTMSLQIKEPDYNFPESEWDDELYSEIVKNSKNKWEKTFSLNYSKTTWSDWMFNANWNPVTNWTDTSFSFENVNWKGEWYKISGSHIDENLKKPENKIMVNYIFPI